MAAGFDLHQLTPFSGRALRGNGATSREAVEFPISSSERSSPFGQQHHVRRKLIDLHIALTLTDHRPTDGVNVQAALLNTTCGASLEFPRVSENSGAYWCDAGVQKPWHESSAITQQVTVSNSQFESLNIYQRRFIRGSHREVGTSGPNSSENHICVALRKEPLIRAISRRRTTAWAQRQ